MDWSDRIGRRIKLRDLHILLAIVQQGSMARAAKHLAVSQPAVSKVVADLEHAFGVRLLDRDRHGAQPTIYGKELLKHGVVVFDELRQGVKAIEFLTDPSVGELRIGTSNALAAGLIPAVISRMHRQHPRLTFHVAQANNFATLLRELRERSLDLILGRLLTPFAEDDLRSDDLFNDSFVVVAGRGSKWIGRRKIRLADLIDDLWVLPPMGSAGHALHSQVLRACGVDLPRRGVVCASIHMHDALLASGPYLALRLTSLVRFGGKHAPITVLPVKLSAVSEPFAIITLRARTISPVARLFIDCVHEITKSMTGKPGGRRANGKRPHVS
jgi:DNA-binding transcriptional LysR family regulator